MTEPRFPQGRAPPRLTSSPRGLTGCGVRGYKVNFMNMQRPRGESRRRTNARIRSCRASDLPAVARLAARLVRQHHAWDSDRFFIFDRIEEGYAEYLRGELDRKRSVVLVASKGRRILGYAFGRIEPRDWNALLERCGMLHDIYVDERARRKGIARLLVEEMVARLSALGAPRVVLMTAIQNTGAHRLFEGLGFRTTMLEMTRECGTAKTHRRGDAENT